MKIWGHILKCLGVFMGGVTTLRFKGTVSKQRHTATAEPIFTMLFPATSRTLETVPLQLTLLSSL